MMSEQRFYITDTGLGLDTESDEMYSFGDEEDFCRLFDKLNEQQATISALKEENEQLKSARRDDAKEFSALFRQNLGLKKRLDYETRMHKRWKDDCLAILEEQDLNDYVKELQKNKKSGWDSEPNTDYITRVKEGLK